MKVKAILGLLAVWMVSMPMAGAQDYYINGGFNEWGSGSLMTEETSFGANAYQYITLQGYGTAFWYRFYGANVGDLYPVTQPVVNSSVGLANTTQGTPDAFSFTSSTANYYTFRIEMYNDLWYQRNFVVMQTEGTPIAITGASDNSATAGQAVTVTATLDKAPSTETVYVRYTTNGWTNSSMTAMSAIGTQASVTLSSLPIGTEVEYYLLASTLPMATVEGAPDLCTLTGLKDGADNFTFTVKAATVPAVSSSGTSAVKLEQGSFQADYTAVNFAGTVGWTYTVTPPIAGSALSPASGNSTTFTATPTATGTYSLVVVAASGATRVTNTTSLTVTEANLGNAWHAPAAEQPWAGTSMRFPLNPEVGQDVWLRVATYPDGYGVADAATAVTLTYQVNTGTWTTLDMPFQEAWAGNANGAWSNSLARTLFASGDEVNYYFTVAYGNEGATCDTTYLGSTNGVDCTLYASATNAQANPYGFTVVDHEPVLGGAFHQPAEVVWNTSVTMRNPLEPEAGDSVYVYAGNYQAYADGANMTTGMVHYRKGTSGAWTVAGLVYDSEAENMEATGKNKYWLASLPTTEFAEDDVLQYVLEVQYAAPHDTTYLGTLDQTNGMKYADLEDAQAAPYAVTFGEDVPVFGGAFHQPDEVVWNTSVTMRNPLEPEAGDSVYVYAGNYQAYVDGANMTTGMVHYRKGTSGAWTVAGLVYDSEAENGDATGMNKYWFAGLPTTEFAEDDVLQYVFQVEYSAHDTTYLGTLDQTNGVKYAELEDAQAAPYAVTFGEDVPVFGNCWHYPANAEPAGVPSMRNPVAPFPDKDTYIYVGNYRGTADLTGGLLWFRNSSSASWSTNALDHDSDTTPGEGGENDFNQFWYAVVPSNTMTVGDTLEYFIQVNYLNGGADPTFIGTSNQTDNVLLATADEAALLPFRATCIERPADLGNAWHAPGANEPWPGATMRNPAYPLKDEAIAFFVGNQAYGDGGTPGNMTGGWLHHRLAGASSFTAEEMVYEPTGETGDGIGNNKYWKAILPEETYPDAGDMEYYFEISYSDRDTTYLGAAPTGARGKTYATVDQVVTNLFACPIGDAPGQEPGFMWHAGNMVRISEDKVQFWVKIGYVSDGIEWADHVELRYTFHTGSITDSLRARDLTQEGDIRSANLRGQVSVVETTALTDYDTAAFVRDHEEGDSGEHGNTIWWRCDLQDADFADGGKYLEYQVAAWKSAESGGNDKVRFADYKTFSATNVFRYTMWQVGANELTINGLNADYTTTKFFIDEAAGESVELTVLYNPPVEADEVEVFSNVNRRDFWNADIDGNGIADSIFPPSGDLITAGRDDSYYVAIPMEQQSGGYIATLTATNCGAYRLTARYKPTGSDAWIYYSESGSGIRDHAVVISPKKALAQNVYELNALSIKATGTAQSERSTFASLINPAVTNRDTFDEFSIEYLNKIMANCLWFQPIHTSADSGVNFDVGPGSPYAAQNYFAISRWFSKDCTEEASLEEFQEFVAACDLGRSTYMTTSYVGTVNIMLDGVMNHTSWDAVLGEWGVELLASKGQTTYVDKDGNTQPITASTPIGHVRPGWYANFQNYGAPATFFWSPTDHDVATAPDRADFGKWGDTAELFYGRYAALVEHNPENNANYLSETDWFDWSVMTNGPTAELWEYMGAYPEYWITRTGHSGTNTFGEVDANGVVKDDLGIDGLRCDFGQGLPPQFWEYIINRTRSTKWNFMFMAESLDGGIVGYRSNRHFDILNEDFVFGVVNAGGPGDVQNAVETRKSMYNNGAILLNLTSHDEIMPYDDPWKTASRYAIVSTVQGLPMMFYGQEQGISPLRRNSEGIPEGAMAEHDIPASSGFARFELNFGKWVPHFKAWNRLTVWEFPPSVTWGADNSGDPEESRHMAQWYGRVNWARLNSPALRSANQYYLGRKAYVDSEDGTYDHGLIWAVAKAEAPGALTNGLDAVLAFSLFVEPAQDEQGGHLAANETYAITADVAALLGIERLGFYEARNLASSSAETVIWAKSGDELLNDGIWVGFSSDKDGSKLYDDGAMVQFLQLTAAEPPAAAITVSGVTDGTAGLTNSFSVVITNADIYAISATLDGTEYTGYTYAGDAITFLPSVAGTYAFAISASNLWAQPSTNITITISDAPVPPGITISGLADGQVGQLNSFTVSISNADQVWDSATLDAAAFTDYTFSSSTVSFTPAAAGIYAFRFTASNAFNLGVSTNVSLTITNAPTAIIGRNTSISDFTFADGDIQMVIAFESEDPVPTIGLADVWSATAVTNSPANWNWATNATGVIDHGDGTYTVTFEDGVGLRLISIGKPAYMVE